MALAVSAVCEEIFWKQEEHSVISIKNWSVTQEKSVDLDK